MPSKSFEVQVDPTVMKWARESAGRTIGDVATRLGADEELVSAWEDGRKKPTITQLRTLAKYYQRSLNVLLLSRPPAEPSLPHDFRNLPTGRKIAFKSETRFAFRKARRLQSIASELKGSFNRGFFYKVGNVDISTDPESLANRVRSLVGLNIQIQTNWKSVDALKQWISVVERLNVIVIQISMPIEDARAFSLIGEGYPIIVLNRTDSHNARIFSLFHEVGHILLNEDGICDPENIQITQAPSIEKFCNHFAGAFLVPQEDLLNHCRIKSQNTTGEWSEHALQSISKDFKVSEEVILRRLLLFGYTSKEFYNTKRKEWAARDMRILKEKRKKAEELEKKSGGRNIARECIQQNGVPIVSLILESYYDNKLTKYDIANYLEVNLKHLPIIEKTLWS